MDFIWEVHYSLVWNHYFNWAYSPEWANEGTADPWADVPYINTQVASTEQQQPLPHCGAWDDIYIQQDHCYHRSDQEVSVLGPTRTPLPLVRLQQGCFENKHAPLEPGLAPPPNACPRHRRLKCWRAQFEFISPAGVTKSCCVCACVRVEVCVGGCVGGGWTVGARVGWAVCVFVQV